MTGGNTAYNRRILPLGFGTGAHAAGTVAALSMRLAPDTLARDGRGMFPSPECENGTPTPSGTSERQHSHLAGSELPGQTY